MTPATTVPAVILLALALSSPGCRTAAHPGGAPAAAPATPSSPIAVPYPGYRRWLVDRLGDPALTVKQRWEIKVVLRKLMDSEVVDALVEHFDDNRVFDPAYKSEEGDYEEEPRIFVLTVSEECRELAHDFVFGHPYIPPMNSAELAKWWQAHRNLPMDEILRQARESDK